MNSPTISASGPPPQAVLCIAGALMFAVHGSLRIWSAMDQNQDLSIQYTAGNHHSGRVLLATNLGYHIHVFRVSWFVMLFLAQYHYSLGVVIVGFIQNF